MLGKLFKHEMKDTGKIIGPICLLTLVLALVTGLSNRFFPFHDKQAFRLVDTIECIEILTYVLALIVLVIGSAVYGMVRYYLTMYSDRGYLMHTLPVSEHSLLLSRMLSCCLWFLISLVTAFLSGLVCSIGSIGFQAVAKGFGEFFDLVPSACLETTGIPFGVFVLYIGILSLFGFFSSYLQVTFSMAVGQLSHKHRLAYSILTFVGINIVTQIISTCFMGILFIEKIDTVSQLDPTDTTSPEFQSYIQNTLFPAMHYALIATCILILIFYFGTHYINKKKLNLA